MKRFRSVSVLLCVCGWLLLLHSIAHGQNTQVNLKLEEAVALAESNYPSVRTQQAQVSATAAGIDLARTAYAPRLDLLWQENRASVNNIFGTTLPQGIIPSITGPVLGTKSFASTFGTSTGALFSWEPFDFGYRKANVQVARDQTRQAEAAVNVTRLDVQTSAADSFLALLAAEQAVRAAEANVSRAQVFAESVHVLVANELRAGADAARADAELSVARTQLNRAQQTAEISRATLAEAIGNPGMDVSADKGRLLDLPPDDSLPPLDLATHPIIVAQKTAIETARARENVLNHAWAPRFNFQSALYARGSGALLNGGFQGGLHGLYPTAPNFAVGLTVTFPAFDIFSIRARRKIEAGNQAVEEARLDQTVQGLKGQYARAQALIDGARRIARETPNQLKAAQESERLTNERYKYGLATVTEVADAQRLLAQAEIDNAMARLNVWRALLVAARLQGDLKPFLQRAK
ncbi:MAG TPA: TolC family protein [Pyrinomonadaceae bacterium]|nr:TolC family protein [Pyrinomonadaceae bacterium]